MLAGPIRSLSRDTKFMATETKHSSAKAPSSGLFVDGPAGGTAVPIHLVGSAGDLDSVAAAVPSAKVWLEANGFRLGSRKVVLVPDATGRPACVVVGLQKPAAGRPPDPMARPELQLGTLAASLPPGLYKAAGRLEDPTLAAVAWGLGGYRFRRYKSGDPEPVAMLVMPPDADATRVRSIVDGTTLGRDLVNTPSNDMGPAEIEATVRALAEKFDAAVSSIVGDDLLQHDLRLIHAVGRASPRPPRLIDLVWTGPGAGPKAPRVTLVGKGIAFDTGGLDLKPASGMLLMKKDMGGAAAAIACAHMIMSAGLPVRLRVLIASAENAVSGDSFRPLDVIRSRAGLTVEIGNTDAEGRLVLADALAIADEEKPDLLVTYATLTGAARVALGPELPPLFADDDDLAARFAACGDRTADPVWRLPFWTSYEAGLESAVADISNVSDGPFAGSITAALFLRKFVKTTPRYIHLDIYGWRPAPKPLGPKGGEVQGARATFELVSDMVR